MAMFPCALRTLRACVCVFLNAAGSDNSATMTSATAGLDGDVSMRSTHFEGTDPTNAVHPHSINAQGASDWDWLEWSTSV
eukprot:1156499-Pelagomonas_calceolata.AAC.3